MDIAVMEKIRELSSLKGKEKIPVLKKHLEDQDFQRFCKYALDQGVSYNISIKGFPKYIESGTHTSADEVYKILDELRGKRGASAKDVETLHYAACSNATQYKLVTMVLRGNLGCGISAKTINKVSPGLIYRVPYQRCKSGVAGFDWRKGGLVQKKADGMFVYILEDRFLTRNGIEFTIPRNRIQPLPPRHQSIKVLMAELTIPGADRQTSNGLINSFIAGKGDLSVAGDIIASVFNACSRVDFYTGRSVVRYLDVWERITAMKAPYVYPITTSNMIYSEEEAYDFYAEMRALGEEGAVLKDPFQCWMDRDSSNHRKMKPFADCEFEIVDASPGKVGSAFENMLGSITVRSSDGEIESDVGMGFSLEQRERGVRWWRGMAGTIVTVRFTDITKAKTKGAKYALQSARLIEERIDKNTADDLEYCKTALDGRMCA